VGARGVEGLAEFKQGGAGNDGIGRDGELRLPAGGHALDALGHGIKLVQQVFAGTQQLGAGGRELGAARAAVEQQHVERVLDLAHAVGQRTGHHAQLARGGGHAAEPGHGFEQAQVLRREGGALGGGGHGGLSGNGLHDGRLDRSTELNDAIKSLPPALPLPCPQYLSCSPRG
jgi:hypothetical protein